MTRRIEPGSIILTQRECKMLYFAAHLGEVRTRHRIGDTAIYDLLTEISRAAFYELDAAPGNLPRQSAASEERSWWTVRQIALAVGLAERTVRLHCERGDLPGRREPNWVIASSDAKTYIDSRIRN